jgi:hypothetical protein
MGQWMYWQIHVFLGSALVRGEWSDSRHGHDIHRIGGWIGQITDLDDVEKRIFLTLPGLELRLLGRSASRYTDYVIDVPE